MELIDSLVSQLGINTEQAEGGVGVLLNAAKEKLPAGDFSQITNLMPDWEKYLGAAPAAEAASGGGGMLGALGGIASGLGLGGGIGGLASLLGGFEKLGLDMSTLQKFIPMVMEFVKEKGGSSVAGILEGIIK